MVIDTRLSTPLSAELVRTAADVRTIILFDPESVPGEIEARAAPLRAAGAWLIPVRSTGGAWLDLNAVVRGLARLGVTRLLIEGGPTVARSFLEHNLVDEAVIFQGANELGRGGLKPLRDKGLSVFEDTVHWSRTDARRLGPDRMLVYRSTQSRT